MEEMLAKIERRNTEIVSLRDRLAGLSEDKERRDNENGIHIEQLKKLIEHLRAKNDGLEAQLYKGGKGKKRAAEEIRAPPRTPLRSPPRKHFK
jgi:chromosome segregation ATPase